MNKKIFTTILMSGCLALAAFAIPTSLNAQNTQLRYQSRYTKAQVSQIIATLESSSNTFRSDFDRELDNSSINGTSTEDRYNSYVKDYENALDRLRNEFDRNESWWTTRNEVSDVINKAQPVNNIINALPFRRNIERQWNSMRNDLNKLADTFDLPGLNGGGWTGGGGGNWGGGQTSTPPTWAQGAFYGSAPDGSRITLTIAVNGYVTAVINGNINYGTYYRDSLNMNGAIARVTKLNNGIRTRRNDNGETIDYSRTGWAGGGGGGNWGGQTSTPPTWAQGTFYGTGPDGSQITLTIAGNGYATALINGNASYGTYYRDSLNMNGAIARVTRLDNGIRTRRNDNGETIDYSRNGWGGGVGGGNWGGQTSAPPSWAQGTFYGTAPDGSRITLTISNNGQITSLVNGNSNYGTYYRGTININGAAARVTQLGNGIRTTRTDNGEVINYSRTVWAGGGGNWGGGGTPISWAVGSFNARNPQSGGTIYLTIGNNGQVTVNMDGNMSYGTLYGTVLTINGITSTVSRNGNGISTTRNDNGERINYRRN